MRQRLERIARTGLKAIVGATLACMAAACNGTSATPSGSADSGTDAGGNDTAADAGEACSGPLDVALRVTDQSGAYVGQANVTLSSQAMQQRVGRTDAFGMVVLQVPQAGNYQLLVDKVIQADPASDCEFEEYLVLQSVQISCSNEPIDVRGEWACVELVPQD